MSVRKGDSLRRIGLKESGRFSVVCGIEKKTVRGEGCWFEWVMLKKEHGDVGAVNIQRAGAWW